MKKTFIKKIAAIIAVSLTLSTGSSILSIASYTNGDVKDKDVQLEYVEEILGTYLSSYDVDSNSIYISDAYNIYNLDSSQSTNDIYIVFENNSIIGMLSVDQVNGNYCSSFEYNSFNMLQNIYEHNKEISFVSSNESLYIESDSNIISLYKNNDNISYDFSITTEKRLEKTNKVDLNIPLRSVHYYQKNLSVPIVANASINGHGLCWAAALASRTNFINNSSLTALTVYYDLDSAYSGVPAGSSTWIMNGYNYYGVTTTYLNRMLNCVEVYNNIRIDNPIQMSLSRSGGSHAVVLSGITINTDATGIYRLTDSNKTTYVDVAVSSQTMTGDAPFVYATSYGYTYTSWTKSYY